MYIYTCLYTYTQTHTHAYICVCVCVWVCPQSDMNVYAYEWITLQKKRYIRPVSNKSWTDINTAHSSAESSVETWPKRLPLKISQHILFQHVHITDSCKSLTLEAQTWYLLDIYPGIPLASVLFTGYLSNMNIQL